MALAEVGGAVRSFAVEGEELGYVEENCWRRVATDFYRAPRCRGRGERGVAWRMGL
jgi:hypothetical protein